MCPPFPKHCLRVHMHGFTMFCYFPDDQKGLPLYDKLIHRKANQSINVTVYLSCADPPTPKPCHPSCLSSWTLTRFLYARQLSAFSTHLSQIAGGSGNPKSQSPFKLCSAKPSPMNLTFLYLLKTHRRFWSSVPSHSFCLSPVQVVPMTWQASFCWE